jgi:hypothetical protein
MLKEDNFVAYFIDKINSRVSLEGSVSDLHLHHHMCHTGVLS